MRAKVHIFGNKPSPAIANHGLRSTAMLSNLSNCEDGKKFIQQNFYVDDGLAAVNTPEEAINLLSNARSILEEFHIRLHKIASNSPTVLKAFPPSELQLVGEIKIDYSLCNALGVTWDLSDDNFIFHVDIPERPFTKRGVVSVNGTVFDPLGFVSPILLEGKLIQREVLLVKEVDSKLTWDAPLPPTHLPKWMEWVKSLGDLNMLTFPRSYYPINFAPIVKSELHIFSDASMEAIGYVIYMRCVNSNEDINVSFVCAGSKVAPRGATSVPRLELCAALEAAVATSSVCMELNIKSRYCFYYTDSKVVLGYISNVSRTFSRYVCRRVDMIKNVTNDRPWHFVSTGDNPGDIASRKQTYKTLKSSCWVSGPLYLWDPTYSPVLIENLDMVSLPEDQECVLKVSVDVDSNNLYSDLIDRSNNLSILLATSKIVISMFHFADVARQRLGVSIAPRAPATHLSNEYTLLQLVNYSQSKYMTPTDTNKNTSPFVDTNGTIRVGGRLVHSFIPFDGKHPILLPKMAPIVNLIVSHYHNKCKHQGRYITLAAIRNAGFFIHGIRGVVSSFIRNCVTCSKLRGKPLSPKMADLPPDRVQESPPFTNVGIDLFGPYLITDGTSTRRNSATKKVWGVIFICLVTRAIHIESVPGLDTVSFINALRRFFSIRGVCCRIRSDNGSNLVSARSQMNSTFALEALKKEATLHKVEWITNPPGASNFGGSWERAIGSVRKILDASLLNIGERALTRDELDTLFKEACAIVNNTPLYEPSDSSDDPLPISPAHLMLLKDHPNPSPIECFTQEDLNAYGKLRWRRIQCIADEFWHRWRKHYLHTLQCRSKWCKDSPNVRCGDLLILKDKNLKRNDWKTGIVIKVFPSSDGVVRSCLLKTAQGIYRRAVNDLVPLIAHESSMGEGNVKSL